ncbi:MAG: Shikimate dehydrogenase (NADP(+)) [Verrucomicrobia subdivision 3 bacterium]|nr:Shikimate dehydrogenase (NADP(+)) [Limisphaerales bacterium]MCS1414998.1 Shikimate dehydrogenase (NADP(+)) [Limisphaerales bacterium]
MISAATRYCAVYGHPIRHSGSPVMQNAGIQQLGLDWRYLAFDVHPDKLAEAIRGAERMHFVGLNLTAPHKLLAFELVDVLDDSAREWGAVNTIRFEGRDAEGRWVSLARPEADDFEVTRSVGFNTDADAVVRAVEEDLRLNLRGASALVVGVGGAGRVGALKLAESGVKRLFVVNRTVEKAEAVKSEIGERFPECGVTIGYPTERVDLLLNGTSLGLKATDSIPADRERLSFSQVAAVYDMIYQPAETLLLREARAAGCRGANGLGMLVYQGAKALEIWAEREAPASVMRAALEKHIYG